jgi:hypothetical protein
MTWIGLADHTERRFSLRGLGVDRQSKPVCPDAADHLMAQGSIVLETRLSPDTRPQVLFGFNHAYPWQRSLIVQAIPGGGIALVQVQGEHIAHAAIKVTGEGRTDVVRITYAWDALNGQARLTLERPEVSTVMTVPVSQPRPISLGDLRNLVMGRGDQTFASDVIFAAVSDQMEPVGPMPMLNPATPVATPWGYRPVGQLTRGDSVITQSGDVVPVLHAVSRTVPARGSFSPVRLRAPYFGLQQEIVVAPDQRLVIDGPEVEYLFNQEAVLVPARHLVNGFAALPEQAGTTVEYCQLILPGHEALLAAGSPLESLYIGRIRRHADQMFASPLRELERATLPEHGRPSHQVLRWFEAIHLARQRAA